MKAFGVIVAILFAASCFTAWFVLVGTDATVGDFVANLTKYKL